MEFKDVSFITAQEMDAQDELASFRDAFVVRDDDLIYLDGNSLGRLPKATIPYLQNAIENAWGERLIRLWNDGWIDKPRAIGGKIARLLGAQEGEIVVTDGTSVNLFKLAVAALRARPGRTKIVSDVFNFPSDLYIFQGIIDLLGGKHRLELIESDDGVTISKGAVLAALDEDTALVSLSHVAFKSAFAYDMAWVTRQAHKVGALVLWDLSHSVGAVPLELDTWGVDLAVGCTYKYLNGGPGAPAFLYVRKALQSELIQPMWGWFAADAPFDFDLEYKPAADIDRFRVGTPPMLSMVAVEPALDLLLDAGMERLRAKSIRQTEYLIFLAEQWLFPLGFTLGSPKNANQRGSHVCLRHPEGYRITQAMVNSPPPAVKVIPDFRTPDNIRLGIAPLYTRYVDIHRALTRMCEIVEQRLYERYPVEGKGVT